MTHASNVLLITRRQFLQLSAGLTAATVLAGCGQGTATPTPPVGPTTAPNTGLPQPKTISAVNGLLTATLLIRMGVKTNLSADLASLPLRVYGTPKDGVANPDPKNDADWDFSVPGPTLRVKPGDEIKLKLINYLATENDIGQCDLTPFPPTSTPNPPPPTATPNLTPAPTPTATSAVLPSPPPAPTSFADVYPNCFNEYDVTNLHYHGLHVNQQEQGDDVLLALYPVGQDPNSVGHEEHGMTPEFGDHEYDFFIPKDHPQGTFWYHPHKHGATAIQVSNGLAGALIVEDEAASSLAAYTEQVVVIQRISVGPSLQGGAKGTFTVNGVDAPAAITLQAGEVQRWRLVNATMQEAGVFQLEASGDAPVMFLIAVDGNYLTADKWKQAQNTPLRSLFLPPGGRADVLVQAKAEGIFGLGVQSAQNGGGGGKPGGTGGQSTPTPGPKPAATLLNVTVQGRQAAMSLPATLPALPNNLRPFGADEKDVCARTITFEILGGQQGGAPGSTPQWAINGKKFDGTRVDECMVLGTSETWTLLNTTTLGHPFHIHVNPFWVLEFDDPNASSDGSKFTTGDDPVGQWQDTIIIPPASFEQVQTDAGPVNGPMLKAGKVVIRHRFPDITGKFVLHCHILGHEDRGMMQLLEIVDTPADCTSGACAAPQG